MEYVSWAIAHYADLLEIAFGIIASASIIVRLTPSSTDNVILDKVISFLNALALNTKR